MKRVLCISTIIIIVINNQESSIMFRGVLSRNQHITFTPIQMHVSIFADDSCHTPVIINTHTNETTKFVGVHFLIGISLDWSFILSM